MEKEKLFESLDGLMAYDLGAIDSGIKDESLRVEVKNYLNALEVNSLRIILSEFIRDKFVSEEAIEKGYGIEDVSVFLDWIKNEMNIKV